MALMMLGVLPVSAVVRGQQRIKIALDEVFRTRVWNLPTVLPPRDGHTRPVVVVGLQQLRAKGVCASQ
ncbi:hypothetical protein SAMN05216266_14221 [Amycolatopsis marina]|nr:hypothetical protein [Prauserella muralis]TWE15024.1 hypothetical protein FHX69_7198 [Prauserella muralis]SDU62632.1 hypothetical protein SAMN04489733_7251 [Amycolatopsis keratiniphila]SFB64340.1 hypothetical protein SAMN05216266_14221 [Amycolatopsis marina]